VKPDPIKQFFLDANPNPAREGCPSPDVLRAIAANTIPPNDPASLHLAECSPCFKQFLTFKEVQEHKPHKRTPQLLTLLVAIAASLAVVTITVSRHGHQDNTPVPIVRKTVDLSHYGAYRGSSALNQLNAVSLPNTLVQVMIILPLFSDAGVYKVAVSEDRTSTHVLTAATANAQQASNSTRTVTVLLDLRATRPGTYFLTTTHNNDEASYFYPLQVK
jgi:hypothetical protein